MIAIAAVVFFHSVNHEAEEEKVGSTAADITADAQEEALPASMQQKTDIINYQEGFTRQPISDEIKARIMGISYKENPDISYDDLQYLTIRYVDFEGNTKEGEMICNMLIAQDLLEIFYELYEAGYPIANISLIDDYHADDQASMEANNSSCFNYRTIAGSDKLSNHAMGMAVDINPLYNPYVSVSSGKTTVMPASAEIYADREQDIPGKIDSSDLCYQLFTAHGFTWGGEWESRKDYQHFEK